MLRGLLAGQVLEQRPEELVLLRNVEDHALVAGAERVAPESLVLVPGPYVDLLAARLRVDEVDDVDEPQVLDGQLALPGGGAGFHLDFAADVVEGPEQ